MSVARWTAWLPAFLLLLYAAWCGNLAGAGVPWASAVGWLIPAVLLSAPRGAWSGASPWRRSEVVAFGVLGAPMLLRLETLTEPFRALATFVLLGGLAVVLPGWVASCWRSEERAGRGALAVATVLLAVGGWALLDAVIGDLSRPAMPIGHHNPLAAWVVIVAPLAALGLKATGWRRGLCVAALGVGLATLFWSRSLGGLLALVVELGVAALFVRRPRLRWALAALGGVALLLVMPRLAFLLAGSDSSFAARRTYWLAGWEGFLTRPWWGWGPGSVPKTLGAFLEPLPGVNPPSEAVGQLHSLPLQLAYELGAVGLVAVVWLVGSFWWRCYRARDRAENAPLLAAGLIGLSGAVAASFTDAWLHLLALPVAVSVAAGAALAGLGGLGSGLPARSSRYRLGIILALQVLLVFQAARLGLGQLHYQRAMVAASQKDVCRELDRALRFEAAHPLYLARRGACGDGDLDRAQRAASLAPGVGAFATSAGLQAARQDQPFEGLLRRGLAADPLGAAAAYYLMALRPSAPDAAACGARALLSEPRLFAATIFEEHPELIDPIRQEVLRWPGIDAGFRQALAEVLGSPPVAEGPTGTFGLGFDDPQGGLSLYAFHRRPWPWEWFAVPVRVERFEGLELPSAAELSTSRPEAFPKTACRP